MLDALNAGHRFSLSEVVNVIADGLTALGKVHDQLKAVHGDMKPGNLMLRLGKARGALSDLGSAMPMGPSGAAPIGGPTYLYLPPEAFAANEVTVASDIYSTSLTAFEMLNGRFDYPGLVPGAPARLGRGLRGMPDNALHWSPHVPKELRVLLQRGFAIDPAKRPPTTHAMLKELRRLRFIDWRRTTVGPGLQGVWAGTWPARLTPSKRRAYRVEITPMKRSGRLRVIAKQRTKPGGPWQKFGVATTDIAPHDSRALAKVFAAVSDRVRQLVAA